jgi:hypothetical protein
MFLAASYLTTGIPVVHESVFQSWWGDSNKITRAYIIIPPDVESLPSPTSFLARPNHILSDSFVDLARPS